MFALRILYFQEYFVFSYLVLNSSYSFLILSAKTGHGVTTLLAFTCSKLTVEKLEQGVKYVQSLTILFTLNIFHTLL